MPRPRKESSDLAVAQPHVRPIEPLKFDALARREWTPRQLHFRQAIDEVLREAVRLTTSTVGSGRAVYFRANDPEHHLVPDAFVKLGIADHRFEVWKVWERGAPNLAFEISSVEHDSLGQMIERYHELGVSELVVFDVNPPTGRRLRVWDRIDGDFVERVVEDERTQCLTLDIDLAVGPILVAGVSYDACVRLVADRERHGHGKDDDFPFVPTDDEAQEMTTRAELARELRQQASLTAARTQRAAALARSDERAAEMTSSNDRRLAAVKGSK